VVQAHDTVTWWVLASILVALTALLLSAYWLWPKIGTRVPVNMDAVLTSRITRHGDAWWAVATILICLGGVALIGDIVISNTSPQLTHSAEIFQEIANAGTFLAAAAAWATVTLNRRAARRSTAESAPPKHPKDAEGLSDNEYRFMTEFMNNVMLGRLNSTQAAQIERMIMILRESGSTMELPLVVTGNGESAVSPAKSRAEPGSQSQRVWLEDVQRPTGRGAPDVTVAPQGRRPVTRPTYFRKFRGCRHRSACSLTCPTWSGKSHLEERAPSAATIRHNLPGLPKTRVRTFPLRCYGSCIS
jgi:hypothetical protein